MTAGRRGACVGWARDEDRGGNSRWAHAAGPPPPHPTDARARPGAVAARRRGASGGENAAHRHREARAELPRGARRLSAGDPAIPTVVHTLS